LLCPGMGSAGCRGEAQLGELLLKFLTILFAFK